MTKAITKDLAALGALAERIRKDINKAYPPGTRVGVMLSGTQKHPTPATVRGSQVELSNWSEHAWGYLRVEIDTAKEFSRQTIRTVSLDMVRPL
jgi:hypothetical protein